MKAVTQVKTAMKAETGNSLETNHEKAAAEAINKVKHDLATKEIEQRLKQEIEKQRLNEISGILHQEQELNGKTVLRPIASESKFLSDTEMMYAAPKVEMVAVVTFVEKYRAYLGSEPFKLRVDNSALSWLKT